jgi:acyl-CoA synthetase (AMP-forming)/AMP-acid ligase II
MKNCPEWMAAFVAVSNIGAVPICINSRGEGEVMLHAMQDADSVFMIADVKRLNALSQAGCDLPAICVGGDAMSGDVTPYAAVLKSEANYRAVPRKTDDTAVMFFTSGTTGRAKAAVMTHRNIITGLLTTQMAITSVFMTMAKQYGMTADEFKAHVPQGCSIMIFPLFHVSGCIAIFLSSLMSGGKLVMMNRWDASEALRLIEAEKISSFGGVPTMHWDLVQAAKNTKHDLTSLRAISCGGQALPLGLLAEIRATFPGVIIGAGYGMTEASGAVSQATGEGITSHPKASGQMLAMVDVKVTDEVGKELPTGEIGEFWVRGPTVIKEYYKRPEANAKAFKDGWYRTGDIGKLDSDGYLTVVDRKTDMVISGGENIYCVEVEQALGRHPAVRQVTTFGVADDRLGERLVAGFVIDGQVTADELMDFAKENLAAYKVPTDILLQADSFELNAMGKIEKHKVRVSYLARKKKEQAA